MCIRDSNGTLGYLLPDGKTQVSVVYENDKPVSIDTILIEGLYAAVLRARSLQLSSRCCADGSSGARFQPPVKPITPPIPALRAI